jgi:SSS family solute:Na+ symporter
MLYTIPNPVTKREHFGGSAFALSKLGLDTKLTIYAGFVAVSLNLIISVIGTLIARAAKVPDGKDATAPSDYFADEGDPKLR